MLAKVQSHLATFVFGGASLYTVFTFILPWLAGMPWLFEYGVAAIAFGIAVKYAEPLADWAFETATGLAKGGIGSAETLLGKVVSTGKSLADDL